MKREKDLCHRTTSAVFPLQQLFSAAITFVTTFFRARAAMGFELVALRSQLALCQNRILEKSEPRPRFNRAFRALWAILSRFWDGWRSCACLMQPDTVICWQRNMFRLWWRWKSRRKPGRPPISREMQALIRRLSRENVLWSPERIHGHLKLLGFDPPCPDTIRKYMVKPRRGRRRSQTWLAFLRNHVAKSWAMDFLTVSTINFRVLYVLVIIKHSSRKFVHWAVTDSPSMQWTVQQLREASAEGVHRKVLSRGAPTQQPGREHAGSSFDSGRTARSCQDRFNPNPGRAAPQLQGRGLTDLEDKTRPT